MRSFVVLGTLLVALLAVAPVAAAESPVMVQNNPRVRTATLDVCDFPITVTWTQSGTLAFFYDEQTGSLTRIVNHITEQDTFTNEANGKTLTGSPYHYNFWVAFPAGTTGGPGGVSPGPISNPPTKNYASGVVGRLALPDGTVFFSAGRIDWISHEADFLIAPDVGVTGDIDAFCAYFA
jgi:hypothetical protein